MSRRYALRFYAFDAQQRIVSLPMEAGLVKLDPKLPELHIWGVPVRRLFGKKDTQAWPDNLDWPTDNLSANGPAQESIVVLFVPTAALTSALFFQELIAGSTALRRIEPLPGAASQNQVSGYQPSPIITVSLENVMALYEESAELDYALPNTEGWRSQRQRNRRLYRLGIDHRVKFLDSSIWHRYVACDEDFETNLLARLSDMATYSDLRLYRSLASLASLEFQCRMLLNSFIAPLGGHGHHEAVTPFKFHSETWMAQQADAILDFLRKEGEGGQLIDLQWGTLTVDDQANQPISTIDDPPEGSESEGYTSTAPSKLDLIKKWLAGDPSSQKAKMLSVEMTHFTKGTSNIIQEGIAEMQQRTFDVIFLDYLLGLGGALRTNDREYGHEFLLELATNTDQQLRRGPLGRHWISPISSFPFAFADKLRQLGMEGVSDRWYISEGGDPIATPEMFRFNFLRMALLQISECYLYPAAMVRLLGRFSGIETPKQWGGALKTALDWAELSQKMLASDHSQGSPFAQSMRKFLTQQKQYKRQTELLQQVAELMGRLPDADWYRQLDDVQIKLEGNMPKHPILKTIEAKLAGRDLPYHAAKAEIEKAAGVKNRFLDLKNRGLLGVPTEIGQCISLEHLDLSSNRIAKLPPEIGLLPNLARLDLSDNKFPTVPAVLEKLLPTLEWIDLRENPRLGDLAHVYEGEEEIKALLSMAADRQMLS